MHPTWMTRIGLWMYNHIGGIFRFPVHAALLPRQEVSPPQGRCPARILLLRCARGRCAADGTQRRVGARARRRRANAHALRGGAKAGAGRSRCRMRQRRTLCRRGKGRHRRHRPVGQASARRCANIRDGGNGQAGEGRHGRVPRGARREPRLVLQNDDRRVAFIIPFEERFGLMAADVSVGSIGEAKAITVKSTASLVRAVNRFLAKPVRASDIDRGAVRKAAVQRATPRQSLGNRARLRFQDRSARRQAAAAVDLRRQDHHLPQARRACAQGTPGLYAALGAEWTDGEALPGGDFSDAAGTVRALQALPETASWRIFVGQFVFAPRHAQQPRAGKRGNAWHSQAAVRTRRQPALRARNRIPGARGMGARYQEHAVAPHQMRPACFCAERARCRAAHIFARWVERMEAGAA